MRVALLGAWFLSVGLLLSASIADGSTSSRVSFDADLRAPVVKAVSELWVNVYPAYDMNRDLRVHSMDWEVRDSRSGKEVDRFPANVDLERQDIHDLRPGHREVEDSVVPGDLHGMRNLSPGRYDLALIVNGVRGSNILSFRIDPSFEPAKAPVLTLGVREASPGRKLRSLTVWVVGPGPLDPKLTNFAVTCADIDVDGKKVSRGPMIWEGPVFPIRPGEAYVTSYGLFSDEVRSNDLDHPLIDPTRPHDFKIHVGRYTSNTITANLSQHPWNEPWDAAAPAASQSR